MKNFTTCICIMGLSGVAAADIQWDQIGDYDGSGIGANIMASQDFEAAYDIYDIVVADNFTGDGSALGSVELVLGGWNGFVDPSSINGYTVNLHSNADAAGADLAGDLGSEYVDAAGATLDPMWTGANFLVGMDTSLMSYAGDQLFSVSMSNDFATGGQTGIADAASSDGTAAIQANPLGGFGFGAWQEVLDVDGLPTDAAYRIGSFVPPDPCSLPLPETCAADVDMDGTVAVSDVLAIIGQWGNCGDGTFRPTGDVAPLPNGDCCVTVADVLAVVGSWGADCTVYGACCYADESCADTGEADCTGAGGSWNGSGSDCAGTSCAIVGGDECATALVAVSGANAFDTTNMTPGGSVPDESQCEGTYLEWGDSQDVWFMYVADGGMTNFDTCDSASYDTSLVLYEGSCDNQVACNGDATDSTGCQAYHSAIDYFDCVAGETYYIRIGAWQGADAGPGTLNITPPQTGVGACCFPDETCLFVDAADCTAFGGNFQGDGTDCSGTACQAGPGDECSTAVAAVDGANAFDTTFMTASDPVPDDTMCPGEALDWMNSPDMWMAYVATADGLATFTTCDTTSFDTSMVIYEGTCDNQIACNGDADDSADGAGGACQAWYSRIDDVSVTAGETYYIRLGGWQEAIGAGTLTITTGSDVAAACCFSDGSCQDLTAAACGNAGGSYDGSSTCADGNCPQPFACPAGADQEGDPCQVDGTEADSNCGLNCNPAVFGSISLGVPVCGDASVMFATASRDTDWYYNADLNAGGDFTLSGASNGSSVGHAFGIVDNVALAFVYVFVTSTEDSLTFSLAPGDYSVFAAQNSFDAGGECGSGMEEYWVRLDASAATTGACCYADLSCADLSATDCAASGGSYDGSQDCSTADCTPTACPAGEIEDCNDNCCPANWVGDGYCDDGTYTWVQPDGSTVAIFLNCDEFNNDEGDCP